MDSVYDQLKAALAVPTDKHLFTTIVDAPFAHKLETVKLSLGIIVFLLADKKSGLIYRIALSNTELAEGTKSMSPKRFEEITIPLDYPDNIIAEAIRTNQPQSTTDWKNLFAPALTPAEARFNQAGGAIACSSVYPLPGVGDGAAMIFSYYQYAHRLGHEQRTFMEHYSRIVTERLAAVPSPLALL